MREIAGGNYNHGALKCGIAKKITAFAVTAVVILCCVVFTASAKAEMIGETVSLANVNKNQSGEGYYWDNINDTLTLNGLDINTDNEYGMKLPDNAVVVLVGTNTISASKAALVTTGNTIFKGSGTLTLVSDDTGILLTDATELGKVSILSGDYKISVGGAGISSEKVRLYISGGTVEIDCNTEDAYAIRSRLLELNNTVLTANGTLYSSDPMVINNTALEISASGDALETDTEFRISNVVFSAGDKADLLTAVSDNAYIGGRYVSSSPTYVEERYSKVFGDDVPAYVDYLVFTAAAVALAAVIAVPLILHRRKYLRRLGQLKASGGK